MQCVILAGGLGTRMWPESASIPKTLLPVANRPFAHWQLSWLADAGITEVVYSLGFLGKQVVDFVGDGSSWGLQVRYVVETDGLLGTAGALRLAYDEQALDADFLVLYGDSLLQVDPSSVLTAFRTSGRDAMMTVFPNDDQWDSSNAVLHDGKIVRYEKGLVDKPADMRWIDYGLLVFRRATIASRVQASVKADLADLCTGLARSGDLAGFEVSERFYEIGSVLGRAEAEQHLVHLPANSLEVPRSTS